MMSKQTESTNPANEVDPALSAKYRHVANELAPDRLNRAVLRRARKAAGRGPFAEWLTNWYRPAAFVATVLLSLGLFMEFNDAGVFAPPVLEEGDTPINATPANILHEAGTATIETLREAESIARQATENSAPAESVSMDAPNNRDQAATSPADTVCSVQQRSTLTTWWQCIQTLENRGLSETAERELAALLKTFPGFVTPD